MIKVLIFYISKFSGHFQAAENIRKSLIELSDDVEVKMINAFDYMNPFLGRIVYKAYLEVIKKKPHIWGNMYDNPEVLEKTKKARAALHKYNKPKMKKLLESYDPDVVICTQAFPCGMVADYKKDEKKDLSLIGVLTDHAPHSYWLFEDVDCYIVPSSETKEALINKGVNKDKINVLGIPIGTEFSILHDKNRIRELYGVSDEYPVILIMGGSQGLGSMEKVVRSFIEDMDHHYQVLVVAGKNKKLFSRLTDMVKDNAAPIKVYRYVDNIDELMEISDLIITKAGGVTTAEALAKKLPILIVNPIPGQERLNTEYLVKEGAAFEVDSEEKIYEAINRLFDSPDILRKMSENSGKIAKPESSLRIAEVVLKG